MSVHHIAPALTASEMHLWMTKVEDADQALLQAYGELLSPAEAAQASRFVFDKDRRRYLVTRALVRTVLSLHAHHRRAPAEWAFIANEYGCPRIANPLEGMLPVVFNLSHTQGLVVLALRARRAVGIDVEAWDRRIKLDIADHFFSPAEVAALRRLPDEAQQRERFMELWTFKESYIKARTMGLSIPLDQFGFEMKSGRDVALVLAPALRQGGESAERWTFLQFRPDPDHVVAVCMERDDQGPAQPEPTTLTVHRVVPLSGGPPERLAWPVCRTSRPSS